MTKNNQNLAEDIGNNLREARKRKGYTQAELAEILDTQQPSIARIESGEFLPSLTFLSKIAESLDIDISLSYTPKVLCR